VAEAGGERVTLGIDVGGTFTDVAILTESGRVFTSKAATTSTDPSRGVFAALELGAAELGCDLPGLLGRAVRVMHGSTIATNALLTRTGSRVGLVTTRGFEDTPFVMRAIGRVDGVPEDQLRHVAYLTKPQPLVARSLVRGVHERIDAWGDVVVPLRRPDVEAALHTLVEEERVEAVGVCLLHSWVNPAHEELVRDVMESRYGDALYAAYSHRLTRRAGEYARTNTVLVDAFVGLRVRRYLGRLADELRERGFRGSLLLMQGNGGLASIEQCTAVATLQSGPAGGMLAAAHMAEVLGHHRVLTADMGGTSFDVGIYTDGYLRYAEEPIFDRFRILQPTIEIESVGAGGGTIARVDETTGRLLVGPQSAGAEPGPVCYGAGGEHPTVTDADVVLGIIDPGYFLGGATPLDGDLARAAVEARVARPLQLDTIEAAAGIQQIIDSKMADLIRRQIVRSGHLPEDFTLYAFGGAAPVHAAGFARNLGIETIYVFPTSPVFSAFGIALADVRHTRVITCRHRLPDRAGALNDPLQALEKELLETMAAEGFEASQVSFCRFLSIRFRRQSSGVELELPWDRLVGDRGAQVARLFLARYEELYGTGSGSREAGLEAYELRVDAIGPVPKPEIGRNGAPAGEVLPMGRRRVFLGDRFVEAGVYDWSDLGPGNLLRGPAVVEAEFTTVLLPAGARAEVDDFGNLVLRLGELEEGGNGSRR
jgi:N-methylhydantoinase A